MNGCSLRSPQLFTMVVPGLRHVDFSMVVQLRLSRSLASEYEVSDFS